MKKRRRIIHQQIICYKEAITEILLALQLPHLSRVAKLVEKQPISTPTPTPYTDQHRKFWNFDSESNCNIEQVHFCYFKTLKIYDSLYKIFQIFPDDSKRWRSAVTPFTFAIENRELSDLKMFWSLVHSGLHAITTLTRVHLTRYSSKFSNVIFESWDFLSANRKKNGGR